MKLTSAILAKTIMETPLVTDEKAIQTAILGLYDFFACQLHAKSHQDILRLKNLIVGEQGSTQSWLIGHQIKVSAKQAALFNGFQAHLLDYDDVHELIRGHPSAVILSALFASIDLNQTKLIDSQRFLTAYILGVEIMARFGKAVNPSHYLKGWHSTATLGGIAAVAAICYLHQYDFLSQAFMLSATQSSGMRLVFGSPIKALHAGMAAQQAIQTIEWLKIGLTVEGDFLDQAVGFLKIFANSDAKLDLSDWGKSWQITHLWFKNYSYCSAAASIADAITDLVKHKSIDVDQICSIQILINPNADSALIYKRPTISQQGRFSAEYIVAKILAQESLEMDSFNETPIHASIQKLIQKISRHYVLQDDFPRYAQVNITLISGEILKSRVNYPKGSPMNPYTGAEITQKLINAITDSSLSQMLINDIRQFAHPNNVVQFIQKYIKKL